MIKVIVLEDEVHTRKALIALIEKANMNLEVIGQAGSVQEAEVLLKACQFDLLITDINLSDGVIFQVLENIPIRFQIIYSTAYEEYSLKAIKTGSLTDYILKPIDFSELKSALLRAISRMDSPAQKQASKPDKIVISTLNEYRLLKGAEITYCKSEGSYSEFYLTNGEKIVASKPLNSYKALLANFGFVQTHRSHLVNPGFVIGYNKDHNLISLSNGAQIPLSRRKKNEILQVLFPVD